MRLTQSQRRDLSIIGTIFAVYVLNQQVKNLINVPIIGYFLRNHFNDTMAGFGISAYANLILSFSHFSNATLSLRATMILVTFCSLLWEGIAPRFIPKSTSDILDVFAYLFGALSYWFLVTLKSKNKQLFL